jgi:hypothetical protein
MVLLGMIDEKWPPYFAKTRRICTFEVPRGEVRGGYRFGGCGEIDFCR